MPAFWSITTFCRKSLHCKFSIVSSSPENAPEQMKIVYKLAIFCPKASKHVKFSRGYETSVAVTRPCRAS